VTTGLKLSGLNHVWSRAWEQGYKGRP
jgi:hypothetical protein